MNEHSPKFAMVKDYYDTGRWGKLAVYRAVTMPKKNPYITAEEYEEIVGEPYEE